MTDCNGCGGCCDPVVMPYTQEQAKAFAMLPENKRWILEDLTPMSRHQAKLREPDMVRRLDKLFKRGIVLEEPHYYSCKHFNAETRACNNYEHRPPVCRDYPWLTGNPVPGTPLPAACSFRADIGEQVMQITAKPKPHG